MPFATGTNITSADDFALRRTGLADGPDGLGANKIWLPLWSGEVINAYDQYNVFENLITNKSLTGGYSYHFPMTGTIGLNASWNAGEELLGGDSQSSTIKVDLDKRPMAAHFECDNVDLLVTQWDYRSELARQAGLTLSNTRDRQICMALVAASAVPQMASDPRGLAAAAFHAPAQIATGTTPVSIPAACSEAHALSILQEIENYLVTCQENDVPVGNVYCAVTPKVFQVIRGLGIPRAGTQASAFVAGTYANTPLFTGSDDYNAGMGINMGLNQLTDTLEYMGVKIIKTNHIPKLDHADTGKELGGSKYNLTCNGFGIFGIIFQPEAIAGLSLMGMKVDTVQDVRRNTQFTVASMMKGTGILRPEMVKLLTAGATANATDERTEIVSLLSTTTAANWTGGFAAEYAVA
jgi:hypothetical protein